MTCQVLGWFIFSASELSCVDLNSIKSELNHLIHKKLSQYHILKISIIFKISQKQKVEK